MRSFVRKPEKRFRRAKKGNTEELWNLSNVIRDAYRKEIREAKGKSWTSVLLRHREGRRGDQAEQTTGP